MFKKYVSSEIPLRESEMQLRESEMQLRESEKQLDEFTDIFLSNRVAKIACDTMMSLCHKSIHNNHHKTYDTQWWNDRQQMDEIEILENRYHFLESLSDVQAYQINKWTANYLIEIGYPIKKAADVLLDHAKVKVNCPQHSLKEANGDIKKSNLDRLTKAIWTEHSEEEFESTTSVELFKGAMNCVIECNIGIDTVRFRNYKTEEGALLKNYPILYFKE